MSVSCQKCSSIFPSYKSLVAHLSHNKNCKCKVKDYYDTYIRKPEEGICKGCGKETTFVSIVKGYPAKYCKYCKMKNPITYNKKAETLRKKSKKLLIEKRKFELENYNFKCEICNKLFNNLHGLANHIGSLHKNDISVKEYYDKYIRKEGEGICPVTGNEPVFINMNEGYRKYSGNEFHQNLEHRKNLSEGIRKILKPGNDIIRKRVKKYKETVNQRRELIYQRFRFVSILRKLTIDKNNKIQCQECGKKFDSLISLSRHIKIHNFTKQEYYDKFFKKIDEGICPVSKEKTNFISIETGYYKYANGYQQKSQNVINSIQETRLKSFKKILLERQDLLGIEIVDLDKLKKTTDLIDLKCKKCGENYKNRIYNLQIGYGKCPRCYPRNTHISIGEKEIFEFTKFILPNEDIFQSFWDLTRNEKTGRNTEIDIYIPSKKLAIEFDGLYWHSDQVATPKDYHIVKTIQCKEKDVQLIHIFEDEWNLKKDIVMSMICHKLGESNSEKIYARKCFIKEIDVKAKNEFLDLYHLQGKDKSNVKLGAFYNDKLVSVMTFSYGNISRGGNPKDKTKIELSRFCSDYNYNVIGIASKLLSHFKKNYKWEEIYSYADRRWSKGNLYEKLGFELESISKPNYWYIDSKNCGKRIHRFNLRKRKDEPKNIPEWILRSQEGFYRIFDCGHLKFKLTKKE